jgi:hypothetical protein
MSYEPGQASLAVQKLRVSHPFTSMSPNLVTFSDYRTTETAWPSGVTGNGIYGCDAVAVRTMNLTMHEVDYSTKMQMLRYLSSGSGNPLVLMHQVI